MKISITNLNRSASVQSIRELFTRFGDVRFASLVLDRSTGRSRGVGHIEMRETACGERAIAALNNTSFLSQSINVRQITDESADAFLTHF